MKKDSKTGKFLSEGKKEKTNCKNCGKEFYYYKSDSKGIFCSKSCYGEYKDSKITINCEFCGEPFDTSRNNRKYCSNECRFKHMKEKRNMVECYECGKKFHRKPFSEKRSSKNFCSRDCQMDYRERKTNIEIECDECGEKFIRKKSYLTNNKNEHIFCSTGCRNKYYAYQMRGKNHPRWKGGISYKKYGEYWLKQRRKVLKSDNHTCQICNKEREDMGKREPQVHHINANLQDDGTKNNDLDNLMTLCRECHNRTEYNNWLPEVV